MHRVEMLLSLALCSKLVWVGMLVFRHVDVVCMPLLSQSPGFLSIAGVLTTQVGETDYPRTHLPACNLDLNSSEGQGVLTSSSSSVLC